MTASSGPGISLMAEGISYLAGAELPNVIVDVQRVGPGLGYIWPEQSDYNCVVKGGGHGSYKNIVFAPASVLIDKKYEALYYSGDVDRFLQIAPGEDNRNLLLMAREGLRPKLRAALESARGGPASKAGAQAYRDGKASGVRIAGSSCWAIGRCRIT